MKRPKTLFSFFAAALSAAILAGCSSDQVIGGSTSTSGTRSTEPTSSQTATETNDQTVPEPSVADDPLMEREFADNRVLVVLTHAASLEFREYGAEDFPEIGVLAVTDLSVGKAKKEEIAKKENPTQEDLDNLNKFNQILCIELAEPGKENVVKAVRLLQTRADIASAEPDYVYSLDD